MSKGLFGRKIGMTQVFTEDGTAVPVTVIEAGPCRVVQRKTTETDGYEALQLGFDLKPKGVNKPLKGHYDKQGVSPAKHLKEIRTTAEDPAKPGDEIRVDIFKAGELVDVTGISKGRGFQGVVKRHGYAGGPASHGSMSHRRGGSVGAGTDPGRTWKGTGMPGHMGAERVTVQNIKVVEVDSERNVMLIQGGVPGPAGGYVLIRQAVKGKG